MQHTARSPLWQHASNVTTLLDEVRQEARALSSLRASVLGPEATARLRACCEKVEEQLSRDEILVLLSGPPYGKRTFINAVVGEQLLAPHAPECDSAVISVRRGPVPNYEARMRDGTLAIFEPSQALAIREAEPVKARGRGLAAAIRAFWARFFRWLFSVLRLRSKELLGAREVETRRHAFAADVRALTDAGARGAGLAELRIHYPAEHMPTGVALADATGAAAESMRDHAAGCIEIAREPGANAIVVPADVGSTDAERRVITARLCREAAREFDRVQSEWPFVLAGRASGELRDALRSLADRTTHAEKQRRERIAALERYRIPDPPQFRAGQMRRMAVAVDDRAGEALRALLELLRSRIAELRKEWIAEVEACADRAGLDACITKINETASSRLTAIGDEVTARIIAELQAASEKLQTSLLEEIRSRYESGQEAQREDPTAAVIHELPDEALALSPAPLAGAIGAFETKRVRAGLGGVAAGATIGTLILPGIGTAVGAFLGTLASLLESTGALKRDCISKLGTCLDDVERTIRAQLEGSWDRFSQDIRVSLEDALEAALSRRSESIARLIEMERDALEREREALRALSALREDMDRHTARVASIAKVAALGTMPASRGA
jgi:hypothetical protein